MNREREVEDLKAKIAEVLAVMPTHPTAQHMTTNSYPSPLDPNARIYTPQRQHQIPVSASHSAILEALSADGHD
jgi:hypothetical protein